VKFLILLLSAQKMPISSPGPYGDIRNPAQRTLERIDHGDSPDPNETNVMVASDLYGKEQELCQQDPGEDKRRAMKACTFGPSRATGWPAAPDSGMLGSNVIRLRLAAEE